MDKRTQALQARRSLSSHQVTEKSEAILEKLRPYLHGRVAIYLPFDNEVEVQALLSIETCRFCIPIAYANHTMEFFDYTKETQLQTSRFGILEPVNASIISKEMIDVMIIPMVAFDTRGHRLGHGAGYYDRYLSKFFGLIIGVAFDCQKVADIAVQPHDISMDLIVTESQVITNDIQHVVNAIEKRLNNGEDVVLGIDGNCGSGKSTLANFLEEKFPCTRISMDDFFLPFDQRGTETQDTDIPNVDYVRLLKEVIVPLQRKESIPYQRYDCQTGTLLPVKQLSYHSLTIVEGSYCMHPYFRSVITLSIFMRCDRGIQLQRIKKRSPERYDAFVERFIPMEDNYFQTFQIEEACDMIIDTSNT